MTSAYFLTSKQCTTMFLVVLNTVAHLSRFKDFQIARGKCFELRCSVECNQRTGELVGGVQYYHLDNQLLVLFKEADTAALQGLS